MQPRRGLLNGRYVGAWTHAPARDTVASGEGATIHTRRYLCVQHIPPSASQVAADRDNKARACPARKPEKYFSFRQLPLPRRAARPSALFPSEPPALLIAKNHFSSVQLSSGFSSCVFSFSIFLYFFVRSLQKCFSSPGCTCCAGSSFVAGFSFRRKFA